MVLFFLIWINLASWRHRVGNNRKRLVGLFLQRAQDDKKS